MKPFYSLPNKPAVNFKPLPPPPQHQQLPQQTAPQPIYGLPQQQQQLQIRQPPAQAYGPPKQPLIHGAGCDGWKPIPNPHPIGSAQQIGNIQADHSHPGTITIHTQTLPLDDANQAPVQSDLSESAYLPSPANNLASADNINLSVQPLPANLQLPIDEASGFHDDSGLGLTNINVVKSEGIEVCVNDSA